MDPNTESAGTGSSGGTLLGRAPGPLSQALRQPRALRDILLETRAQSYDQVVEYQHRVAMLDAAIAALDAAPELAVAMNALVEIWGRR